MLMLCVICVNVCMCGVDRCLELVQLFNHFLCGLIFDSSQMVRGQKDTLYLKYVIHIP